MSTALPPFHVPGNRTDDLLMAVRDVSRAIDFLREQRDACDRRVRVAQRLLRRKRWRLEWLRTQAHD